MKVLMLGNSFTYFHEMPKMLAAFLDAEVDSVTRGGAYLHQMLDPEDELYSRMMEALHRQKWDYIVLQEQSSTPALKPDLFHRSVKKLCDLICENGAKPVLYASWAYREGSEKLSSTGLSYEEMEQTMHDSYQKAAQENNTLMADVGKAFSLFRKWMDPYEKDDYHPSEAGSLLTAHVIGKVLEDDWKNR